VQGYGPLHDEGQEVMAGPERDDNGKPTRLLLSLNAWGASSKADAKAKAKAISARNEAKKK
jgi:uncharacterized protein YciI